MEFGPGPEKPPQDAPAASEFDRTMMRRCLDLARQGWGQTAPNPLVGSVVVRSGTIVGEGFHPGAGQPHAEVFALRAAGELARGATVYVNLEPCNHHGRTPPCAAALVAAGVARVVVGTPDPNPQASGGVATLRAAGIEVLVGVESAACARLNEAFFYRLRTGRPFGILKYAMTLDGKIATASGHSQWVSGPQARSRVHHLRAGCQAAIVGTRTVQHDNPHLTSHGLGVRNPLRVVMSRSLALPQNSANGQPLHLWQPEEAPTLVLTEPGANPALQAWLRDRGVEVAEIPDLSPAAVMDNLARRDCLAVLWECGGTLSARAIAEGAVQKVLAFIAPKLLGGPAAPSPIGELGHGEMNQAIDLHNVELHQVGPDWAIEGYLPAPRDLPLTSP